MLYAVNADLCFRPIVSIHKKRLTECGTTINHRKHDHFFFFVCTAHSFMVPAYLQPSPMLSIDVRRGQESFAW